MTRKTSKKPKIEKKELFCRVPMEQYKQIQLFCKKSNQKIPDFIRSLLNDFFKNNSVEEEPQVELARLLFQMELLLLKLPSQEEQLSYFKRLDALKHQLLK